MIKEVHDVIIAAMFAVYNIDEEKVDLSKVTTEMSRKDDSGDIATNIAMVVSKHVKSTPIEFAECIIPYIEKHYGKGSCAIAGPGFINIAMEPMFWLQCLHVIMKEETDYGSFKPTINPPTPQKANVEYVSANPTGPLHIGHARGAIFGDVLASLFEKTGVDVTREYYVNDAGGQIDALVDSIYIKFLKLHGMNASNLVQTYDGSYIEVLARAWNDRLGGYIEQTDDKWKAELRDFALPLIIDMIKCDLAKIGIVHDVFTYESDIVKSGGVKQVLNFLRDDGHIYKGVLPPPKGKETMDYDDRNQLLFKSTNFGDDVDRPLKKADGSWTYFATDVAYHYDKYKRGFNHIVDIWGADHGGYVARVQAAVSALTLKKARVDVCLGQMVNLIDDGKKLKMSKRDGNFVTVDEVVSRVGKDALRFTMLTRKIDAQLDFDFQKVVEESKDNMSYYVQYAHARACSVLRKAPEMPEYEDVSVDVLTLLVDDAEMAIVKHLSAWADVVQKSANNKEPHRIAYYLYELAGLFHALHSKGNNNTELRFLVEDEELTMARLILVQSVAHVLKSGLDVLGVSAPKKM